MDANDTKRRLEEVLRRIDRIERDLYGEKSEVALKKIPVLGNYLERTAVKVMTNESEFQHFKDTIEDMYRKYSKIE